MLVSHPSMHYPRGRDVRTSALVFLLSLRSLPRAFFSSILSAGFMMTFGRVGVCRISGYTKKQRNSYRVSAEILNCRFAAAFGAADLAMRATCGGIGHEGLLCPFQVRAWRPDLETLLALAQ